MVKTVEIVIQLIVALGIYNVWLLRAQRATPWRGGNAKTMEDEFRVYGLSTAAMRVVRAGKLLCATAILVGIFYRPLAVIGASGLALFMLGAVIMHAKVRDPIKKFVPSTILLVLSLVLALAG